MPRAKKSDNANAGGSAKAAKKVTKKATKTTKATKAAKPVEAAPAKVEETAPAKAVPEVSELAQSFTDFMAKLQSVNSLLSSLKSDFRALEKKATRELKAAQKASAKRKRKAGNRSPSGFVKPTLISNELATFLEKPSGTEMARTEVTREINTYIRAHSLQDPKNGRKINPDKKLATLLKIGKEDELTYFNLQRYMSPHFQKQGASNNA